MKIAVVTGSRKELTKESVDIILNALSEHDPDLIIHGDCSTGVDAFVKETCRFWGPVQIPMSALWTEFGKRAGPIRNADMAEILKIFRIYGHETICIGFPLGDEWSGTRHCMRVCENLGARVYGYKLDEHKLEG